jgi:hypothetical protein
MGIFAEDLKKGKEAEIRLLNKLNKIWMYVIQNPNEKELDLCLVTEWIEVKLDDKSTYTWNFYIEFECNWKPSWIFRDEKIRLAYWAQCTSTICYLIEWHKLKEYVLEYIEKCRNNKTLTYKWIRLVEQWGNWGRTKWLLIPIDKFKELSNLEINL